MSLDRSSLDMMKSFDRTRQEIASLQPPTDPVLIRQFCERFCKGEIDRFELQMKLLVLDTAELASIIEMQGLDAPRVPQTELLSQRDAAMEYLAPWRLGDDDAWLHVAIGDSWVLMDWARRGVLEQQLNRPRIRWAVTDATWHWVMHPKTRALQPEIAEALRAVGAVVFDTPAYERWVEWTRAFGPPDPSFIVCRHEETAMEQVFICAHRETQTRAADKLWIRNRFGFIEATMAQLGACVRWVLLQGDDVQSESANTPSVSWLPLSVWEANLLCPTL